MNRQEIFDKVYLGILDQEGPGMNGGACAYVTFDGKRCGIGMLIDDATARKWNNFGTVDDVIERLGKEAPQWLVQNELFLIAMQEAHDRAAEEEDFMPLFKSNMQAIAARFSLTMPKEKANA